MYRSYFFTILFLASQLIFSQTIYKSLNSSKMGEQRELKIQLPRNYETNKEKRYPLIIVLDGDYLFEPMAGNVDYYSYWDDMPEAIVVGVNQNGTREKDCSYDNQNFYPAKTGADFFEFLGMELMPFLDSNYRTSKFVVIAGHDITANFINYYLFKEKSIFNAYINLSPDLAPEMSNRLAQALKRHETPKWFYLATASNDIPRLEESIKQLDKQLIVVNNENLHYLFDDFENSSHYSLVTKALPKALEHIFSSYRPIGLKEYDELVTSDNSPLDYLTEKYEVINNNFGIKKPVRINDFLAVGKALEFLQKWNELEELGDLARDQYPASALGLYYLARSYEASGKPKKAMKTYESAYGREEVAFVTVDFMLKKAESIKEDFGY